MKIGLIQYDQAWESKGKNQGKIETLLEKSTRDFSLLIFPEMTLTGFTMKSHEFAEELNGPSRDFFCNLSVKYNTEIFAGIIEKDNDDIFNSFIHINKSGELVCKYRKIHPFSFSGEDKNYKKGNKTVTTTIDNWKIGLSICYDLRFPELFRQYAKQRVDLIVTIANWPTSRISHWRALLKARAIENQCFVAGVNRVGTDLSNDYNGFSSIINPLGEELLVIENQEGLFLYDVPLKETAEIREKLPFLNDITLI
jgi:predicted amidohydrolase